MKYCFNCGQEMPEDAAACPRCGLTAGETPKLQPVHEDPPATDQTFPEDMTRSLYDRPGQDPSFDQPRDPGGFVSQETPYNGYNIYNNGMSPYEGPDQTPLYAPPLGGDPSFPAYTPIPPKPPKKKNSTAVVLIAVIIGLIAAAILFTGGYLIFSSSNNDPEYADDEEEETEESRKDSETDLAEETTRGGNVPADKPAETDEQETNSPPVEDVPVPQDLSIYDMMALVETKTTYGSLTKKGYSLNYYGYAYREPAQALYTLYNNGNTIELLFDMYAYEHQNGNRDDGVLIAIGLPQTYFGSGGQTVSIPQKDGVVFMLDDDEEHIFAYSPDRVLADSLTIGEANGADVFMTGNGAIGADEVSRIIQNAKNNNTYGSDKWSFLSPDIVKPDMNYKIYYNGQPVDTATLYIKAEGGLRLRKGPGLNYDKILLIPDRSTVTGYARNAESTWYFVVYNGHYGWVSGDYVSTSR